MAHHDILHVGDAQAKEWRKFEKMLGTDGVNDRVHTIETTTIARVGVNFTISMWTTPLAFVSGIFGIPTCPLFYAASTNNVWTSGQQLNEIIIDYLQTGLLRVNVLARNGSTDGFGGFAYSYGEIFGAFLNRRLHICFTNEFVSGDNYCKLYLNRVLVDARTTTFVSTALPPPPASGIFLPPDANYISGLGFIRNRNTLVTGFWSSYTTELLICNTALSPSEIAALYHCGRGDGSYSGYPSTVLSTRQLHLPLRRSSDFFVSGSVLRVVDLAAGNHGILTGQGFSPSLFNFY